MLGVQSGKIRALGVTGAKRSRLVPDVPTVAEFGVPGYEFEALYALFAPARTPRSVITKVNNDVNRTVLQADVRQQLDVKRPRPGAG